MMIPKNVPTSLDASFLWPRRLTPVGGDSGESPVVTQLARITADGGRYESESFLTALIEALQDGGAAGDCYAILDAMWLGGFVKKDGSDLVSKIYDLSPAKTGGIYYDVEQETAANQQQWIGLSFDSHDGIQFTPSARPGGYHTAVNTAVKGAGGYLEFAVSWGTESTNVFLFTDNMLVQFENIGTTLTAYTGAFFQPTLGSGSIARLSLAMGASAELKVNGASSATGSSGTDNTGGGILSLGSNASDGQGLDGYFVYALLARPEITADQKAHIESVMQSFYGSLGGA